MNVLPPVYAIILNFNRWRDTLDCLESLARLDYPDLRVILCDNGSADDSVSRIADWLRTSNTPHRVLTRDEASSARPVAATERMIVIRNGANLGFTGGNNVGLRYILATTPANAGYAWLLNNDMVVEPGALRHMVEMAEADTRLAAVGATIYDVEPADQVQEAGGGQLFNNTLVRPNDAGASRADRLGEQRLDYVSGGCMLLRRSVLDTVGILDERFFIYYEDADWCVRMREAGHTLGYCRKAEVWHKASATTGQRSPFKDFHIVRAVLLFRAKHAPAAPLRSTLSALYRFVLPKIVRGEWKRLAAVGRGYVAYRQEMEKLRSASIGSAGMRSARATMSRS